MKLKKLASVLALALALVLVATPAFTYGVSAKETNTSKTDENVSGEDISFSKPKVTMSLIHKNGFFKTLQEDPADWVVAVTVRLTVKNNSSKKLVFSFSRADMHNVSDNDAQGSDVSIKAGKKSSVTVTFFARISDLLPAGLTEAQALKLLNGKKLSVSSTQKINVMYDVHSATENEGTCYISIIGGESDFWFTGDLDQ